MKIICLSCGHKVDLGDDYDDYEGHVKCFACAAMLHIKTAAGGVRAVAFARDVAAATASGGDRERIQ